MDIRRSVSYNYAAELDTLRPLYYKGHGPRPREYNVNTRCKDESREFYHPKISPEDHQFFDNPEKPWAGRKERESGVFEKQDKERKFHIRPLQNKADALDLPTSNNERKPGWVRPLSPPEHVVVEVPWGGEYLKKSQRMRSKFSPLDSKAVLMPNDRIYGLREAEKYDGFKKNPDKLHHVFKARSDTE